MIQDQLNAAAIHLSAAQAVVEDLPQVYSDDTWQIVTGLLEVIQHLEEQAGQEESEGPLTHQDANHD